jgi:serine/threonine protein kinase
MYFCLNFLTISRLIFSYFPNFLQLFTFVLEQCNHDRIVAFYGSYQSHQRTQICMCMEYMDGGSLDKILTRYGKIPELITGAIGAAVIDGLYYLKVYFS